MARLITCITAMLTAFMLTVPAAKAQQVTGTIYVVNKNCVESCGFLKNCARVDVHLQNSDSDADDAVQCTDTGSQQGGPWINDIGQGQCKGYKVNGKWQIGAQEDGGANYDWKTCTYRAVASGVTALLNVDYVDGSKSSVFTCSNDWAGVCQCRKAASGDSIKLPVEC